MNCGDNTEKMWIWRGRLMAASRLFPTFLADTEEIHEKLCQDSR
jgi:hypothetical protein